MFMFSQDADRVWAKLLIASLVTKMTAQMMLMMTETTPTMTALMKSTVMMVGGGGRIPSAPTMDRPSIAATMSHCINLPTIRCCTFNMTTMATICWLLHYVYTWICKSNVVQDERDNTTGYYSWYAGVQGYYVQYARVLCNCTICRVCRGTICRGPMHNMQSCYVQYAGVLCTICRVCRGAMYNMQGC